MTTNRIQIGKNKLNFETCRKITMFSINYSIRFFSSFVAMSTTWSRWGASWIDIQYIVIKDFLKLYLISSCHVFTDYNISKYIFMKYVFKRATLKKNVDIFKRNQMRLQKVFTIHFDASSSKRRFSRPLLAVVHTWA
jgi:hypothetical protein